MNGGNDTKAQSIIILQKRPYKTESGTHNKINDRHEILSQQYESHFTLLTNNFI